MATIKTATALNTEITTNVTQNTTRANTGQNVQDLLENIIASLWATEYVVEIDDGDSPYTVDSNADWIIIADDSSGAITINLPAIASSQHRTITVVKASASNTTTLDGNASETINGATTKALSSQYELVKVTCGATQWWITGN